MAQGLLGRDAVLRVVHQQLLQQVLPLPTQVGNQLRDACASLQTGITQVMPLYITIVVLMLNVQRNQIVYIGQAPAW